jgi:hypothetical protein
MRDEILEDMKMTRTRLAVFTLTAVCAAGIAAAGQPPADTVVGPIKCAECHKMTAKIWEGTHHFRTFTELPRRDTARQIADKLGIKRIKADSVCLGCHYLSVIEDGKPEPIAGIACESCHGGAAKWVKRHGEFSGHEKKEDETPAEAAQRWKDAEAAGMIRPGNLYALAKNCFSCHVVPKEELVNVGGHPAGSPFELVSWSQGEVRHNVWYTADRSNAIASPARQRLMYAVGTAVELEVALRAVAEATVKDRYAVSMAKRTAVARNRMEKIAAAISVPEIDTIVATAKGVDLKLNNAGPLNAAADKVGEAARALAAKYDGSAWAELDPQIPGPEAYKGSPVDVPPPAPGE